MIGGDYHGPPPGLTTVSGGAAAFVCGPPPHCPNCRQPLPFPTVNLGNSEIGHAGPMFTGTFALENATCAAHGLKFLDCEPCASQWRAQNTGCNPGFVPPPLGVPVFGPGPAASGMAFGSVTP